MGMSRCGPRPTSLPAWRPSNRRQLIPWPPVWRSGPCRPARERSGLPLDKVGAEELILFGHDPGMDEAGAFLRRLAGLVKFVLQAREGELDLEAAAAATAQRVGTVQAGLDCWWRRDRQVGYVGASEEPDERDEGRRT